MTSEFGDFISEYGLYLGYALVLIAALSVIILPLINAISNPKTLVRGLLGILFLGVVFLIGYAIAGSEVTTSYLEAGVDTESSSKLIGGALMTMYILIGLALVLMVYTEIVKIFK